MTDADGRHRKLITHYEVPRQARFLTFSCYLRLPLLLDERWRLLLAQSLERAVHGHGFLLVAFVFMPEHVHLVVVPWDGGSCVSDLLFAIKRPMSFRVKSVLIETRDPLLMRLTIRERPGKTTFRFWQEGPGFDRNIKDYDAMIDTLAYIHDNPVQRGLCVNPEDWRWSSWRQYRGLKVEPVVPRVTRWSWGRGLEHMPWPEPIREG